LRWTLLRALGAVVIIAAVLVLPLRWIPPLTSGFMIRAWISQSSDARPIRYEWTPLERISGRAVSAVLAAEDQKFFQHHGFDFKSIGEAITDFDGPRRGASTISQQVAKNLFLWPGRSWLRKGVEAFLTVWIELLWPKQRILEVYLNIAQFGPAVFGVEAAAHDYFHKSAARLNREEAALLAAVLPNPERLRVARPSPYLRQRQAWIMYQAARVERVTSTAWDNTLR
jgi:monofunctional biosynthetic peptidoglycan transglycosylase